MLLVVLFVVLLVILWVIVSDFAEGFDCNFDCTGAKLTFLEKLRGLVRMQFQSTYTWFLLLNPSVHMRGER